MFIRTQASDSILWVNQETEPVLAASLIRQKTFEKSKSHRCDGNEIAETLLNVLSGERLGEFSK
jgi:hypothetical protein